MFGCHADKVGILKMLSKIAVQQFLWVLELIKKTYYFVLNVPFLQNQLVQTVILYNHDVKCVPMLEAKFAC